MLDALDYFLKAPYFDQSVSDSLRETFRILPRKLLTKRTRVPVLLLQHQGDSIRAAVLLFEYKLHGFPTGCYIPMEEDGSRCVVAPKEQRSAIAMEAGAYLIRRGAVLVLVSVASPSLPLRTASIDRSLLATQVREVRRILPLGPSLEETLHTLSRNTRHNFRRARLQLKADYRPVYLRDARPTLEELSELNQSCAFTVPQWVVEERCRLLRHLPLGVVLGLRDQDGRWLSLVGAHREEEMLCLDWQMNRSGLGSISVATAMRSFLIEDEIGRGARLLRFERGTTHPVSRAFNSETTCNWVFGSRRLGRSLSRAFSKSCGGPFANVLSSPSVVWRPDHKEGVSSFETPGTSLDLPARRK